MSKRDSKFKKNLKERVENYNKGYHYGFGGSFPKVYHHRKNWSSTKEKQHFLAKSKEQREAFRIQRYKNVLALSKTLVQKNYTKHDTPNLDIKKLGELKSVKEALSEYQKRKILKLSQYVLPSSANNIQIVYSAEVPLLIINYFDSIKKSINFLDVIDSTRDLPIFPEAKFIFQIYSRLYNQVPREFRLLTLYAFICGNNESFTQDSIEDDYKLLYGYCKIKGTISFILFNEFVQSINFSSQQIQKVQQYQKNHQQLFMIYKNFSSTIISNEKLEMMNWNFAGFGQIDSEEEKIQEQPHINDKKMKKNDEIAQLQEKIEKLLEKDFTFYEKNIERLKAQKSKQQIAQEINQKQEQIIEYKQKLILQEFNEIAQIQENIKRYRQAIIVARQGLNSVSKFHNNKKKIIQIYKSVLKKLETANKQLISQLPIFKYKKQILTWLNRQNLILLEGETGSGKSTQLPQILYEFFQGHKNFNPVLITQPRKLAVRTLAKRIAQEMNEVNSGFIEYQSSYNSRQINPDAKIYIKLDRIVLDQMVKDPLLSKYSCLIIDEAHERTLSIDLILGRIRPILEQRKKFKVIITSASMNIKLFKNYFKVLESIKVPGRVYPITQKFFPLTEIRSVKQKIKYIILKQIMQADEQTIKPKYRGHILVFCPGIQEINDLSNYFIKKMDSSRYKIFSLHERLSVKQQNQIFEDTRKIKIIFTNSLAQTSITINRIKIVIDGGYQRAVVYNPKTRMYSMKDRLIDQSSARQRAGRAGRTNKGFCFRMYSKSAELQMISSRQPEIVNISLDSLVLRLKSLDITNICQFPYLTKPNLDDLNYSLKIMKNIGCLNENNKITKVGKILSKVPLEPILSRSIIQSYFYEQALKDQEIKKLIKDKSQQDSITNQVIIMLSLVVSSYYLKSEKFEKLQNRIMQEEEKKGSKEISGDFFYLRQIFSEFIYLKNKKQIENIYKLQDQSHISTKGLIEALRTSEQISSIFKSFQFNLIDFKREIQRCKQNIKHLKSLDKCIEACLIIGFINNLCLYSGNPLIGYTLISQQKKVQIHHSSVIYQQGIYPKWIICHDLNLNQQCVLQFKIAQTIDYDKIVQILPKQLLKEFQIEQAEIKNPYYQKIQIRLPTIILRQFFAFYKERKKKQTSFMNNMHIIFQTSDNKIDVFYEKKHFKFQTPKQQINNMIRQLQAKVKRCFKYNYMGDIFVQFFDGLKLNSIHSTFQKKTKTLIHLKSRKSKILEDMLRICIKYSNHVSENKFQLTLQISNQDEKIVFDQILAAKKKIYGKELIVYEQIIQKNKRIPTSQLCLRFFIGQCEKINHIFLCYKKKTDSFYQQTTIKMSALLIESQMEMIKNNEQCPFRWADIVPSKNLSGINIYLEGPLKLYNEYQFEDLLSEYVKQGIISDEFEMPAKIIKFRKPLPMFNDFTLQDWSKRVRHELQRIGGDQSQFEIKMSGSFSQYKTSQSYATLYTNIQALVESRDHKFLEKFQYQYNNCSSMNFGKGLSNIKIYYTFNVVTVSTDVFAALEEEYKQLRRQIIMEHEQIDVEVVEIKKYKRIKNNLIRLKSYFKRDFGQVSTQLLQLFKPFTVKVNRKYSYLFDNKNQFIKESVIQSLEAEYNFKVFFIYQKEFNTLLVYCDKHLIEEIRQKISSICQAQTLLCEAISFRNISLFRLKRLIQQIQAQQIDKNEFDKTNTRICICEPRYENKEMLITSHPDILQKIKQKVLCLQKISIIQCEICCGIFQEPYALLNCRHSFCLACLKQFIKDSLGKAKITCPQGCEKGINVLDIKEILNDEQFDHLCNISVKRFVDHTQGMFICFTTDCQQVIFQEKQKQNFQCPSCGIQYCKLCQLSHPYQNCQQHRQRLVIQQQQIQKIQKRKLIKSTQNQQKSQKKKEKNTLTQDVILNLGLKKCPKCAVVIQKNNGCNHIQCKCKCHFCWLCLKEFDSSQQCYNHLIKDHQGVFDRLEPINQE